MRCGAPARSLRVFLCASISSVLLGMVATLGASAHAGSGDFITLPVGAEVQAWFTQEIDQLCRNPADLRSGESITEFRCAEKNQAWKSARAMLEGPHGLARRCAETKQTFDALVPAALVGLVLAACESKDTGLAFAICAKEEIYSKLESDRQLQRVVFEMGEDDLQLLLQSEAALDRWVDAEVRNSLVSRICMQAGGIAEPDGKGELVVRAAPENPPESCRIDPFYDVPVDSTADATSSPIPPEALSRLRDRLLYHLPGGLHESQCPSFAAASEMCGAERVLARAKAESFASATPGAPEVPIDSEVLDRVISDDVTDFLTEYRRHYERELHALAGLVSSELVALSPQDPGLSSQFADAARCFLDASSKKLEPAPPSAPAMKEWIDGLRVASDQFARDSSLVEFIDGEFSRNDGKCTWVRDRVDPEQARRMECEELRAVRAEAAGRLAELRSDVPLLENDAAGVPMWKALSQSRDPAGDSERVKAAVVGQGTELLRLIQRHCDDPDESTRAALGYEDLARSFLTRPGNEGRGFPFCAAYSLEAQKSGFRSGAMVLATLGVGLAVSPFGPLAVSASTFAVSAWDAHVQWAGTEDRSGAYLTGMGSYADHLRAQEDRLQIGAGLAFAAVTSVPALTELRLLPARALATAESVAPQTAAVLRLRAALQAEGVAFRDAGGPLGWVLRITPDAAGSPANRYAALLEKEGYSLVYDPNLEVNSGARGAVSSGSRRITLAVTEENVFPRTGQGLVTRVHEHLHFRIDTQLDAGDGPFLGISYLVLEGPGFGQNYKYFMRLDELNSFGWETEALCRTLASDVRKGPDLARFALEGEAAALEKISQKASAVWGLADREVDLAKELRTAITDSRLKLEVLKRGPTESAVQLDLVIDGREVRMEVPIPQSELADVRASALRQVDRMQAYAQSVSEKQHAMAVAANRVKSLPPERRTAGYEAMRVFGRAQQLPDDAALGIGSGGRSTLSQPTSTWTTQQWLGDFDQELQLQLQNLKRPGAGTP